MDTTRYIRASRLILLTAYRASAALAMHLVYFSDAARRKRAVAGCMTAWSRDTLRVLGMRMDYRGFHGESGATFTVSNHTSYLDILALSAARPTVFVAKREVRGWPVIGWLGALVGNIFIERSSGKAAFGSFGEIEEALGQGVSVAVFPEGTSTDGGPVLEFKSMFFDVPARLLMPVTPASIRYNSRAAHWHGEMELMPHLWGLLGERGLSVTACFNPPVHPKGVALDRSAARKRLALDSRESVRAGLINTGFVPKYLDDGALGAAAAAGGLDAV